ncbi:MAG: SpoVR family protein [Planctomycetes bacterium]|nr:SpoVR family protein [Planctomycetota bacterium]
MRLTSELARWQEKIESHAKDYGLDFFETRFEILSYDELNEVAAFGGFPTRYPHWRFGMTYEQLSKGYEYGAQKIYELVINNDPCYAYLMSSNPTVDQKMVMAHVYGHCDFFKNNYWFSFTNRKMMDEMANHATKVRRLIDRVGLEAVERFIDLALSIENLIDHMAPYVRRTRDLPADEEPSLEPRRMPSKDYMDSFINPPSFLKEQREKLAQEADRRRRSTPEPVRDVMGYLIDRAPLEDWQVEIMEIVRSEAYYFNPQGMTKIMNEGWATYWHQKLMTRHLLDDSEVIDYAETMSGAISSSGSQLNPYQLGLALWHDIEERWDKGRHGLDWLRCEDADRRRAWDTREMGGRDKIFEVRRHHNDLTFVDEFLSEDFCHRNKLFVYGWNPRTQQREIMTRDFDVVKQQLLRQLTNGGHPVIEVVDANHDNRGELRLEHRWEESDLRLDWAEETLKNLEAIWSRPVLLDTVQQGKVVRLRCARGAMETSEA